MSSEVDALPEEIDDEPQVGVRATAAFPAEPGAVWTHLTSTAGAEALLGEGARFGSKGEPWRAGDGSHGVVRSFHPIEQVRVTWHPHEDGPLSMLDVQLSPEGDGTRVNVYHEGRGIVGDPRGDHQHWQDALERLGQGLSS
ncbi:SRPBCC domain-containing protein [Knoellia subterranea]|uniref:Activator of Hsp90 ATPase homologue 1/2-like C-terminal domain-containing protein n=1 Tax=Knoellia subterranea KCTC 19937 TaxID=1385521 RepID=A0A0A0JL01_9MICO|nr:SRPBCC domain-containing protein [Knoellia subterranea]KGN36737.1 hypothetical protein N803_17065 [Knoellia subterranea KCTC 19937]